MFPGDLPRQDHPLPKALDDAAAARLLRAAQADRRMLVRVTVEMLLRTGLRVSEFTGLPADAVVLIGAGPWLHVPVGKLREDRYLPLHPQLVTLIDGYRAAHVPPGHPLLLPRENGRPAGPAHRHPDDQQGRRRRRAAPHPPPPAPAHPGHPGHQPRHEPGGHRRPARPPQPGHDPALRQDRQPHRRRRVLRRHRESRSPLRPARPAPRRRRSARRWPGCAASTTACSATAGAPGRPQLDCAFESICETCSYFQTSIEFRPTLAGPARRRRSPRTSPAAPQLFSTAPHPDRPGPSIMTTLTTITRIMPMSG